MQLIETFTQVTIKHRMLVRVLAITEHGFLARTNHIQRCIAIEVIVDGNIIISHHLKGLGCKSLALLQADLATLVLQ